MKKFLALTAFLFLNFSFLISAYADSPLWLRYPAISPDGKTVVFSYHGDLFTVSSAGGEAHQLTSNPAYDAWPCWSPDGTKIAFASIREGSFDVYVMPVTGGNPKRLTTSSRSEYPMAFADNDHVIYKSTVMPTAKSIIFPGNFSETYIVSTNGGRSKLFNVTDMCDIDINKDGSILYHDEKGYEDPMRKHHTSPITRDIWLLKDGKYTKLTTFNGEDRTPRWAADGKSFYFLSEQDGTFNVYKSLPLTTPKEGGSMNVSVSQLTHFKKNPVRFLSVSDDDLLCYTYDGEIYTQKPGTEPQKLSVSIKADDDIDALKREIKSHGATEIAVSPNGKEVAFVMHGDVYVTATDYKTTKQITDTPSQERNVCFSPDGKALVYAAERGGLWQIYEAKFTGKEDKNFAYATGIKETQLVESKETSQMPKYSPDGKSVAYLENRGTLKVIDLTSKDHKPLTINPKPLMYSYSDGDVWFEWSPDSRWIACTYIGDGGWNNSDIAVVSASGNGELHNITNSGYNEGNGKWVLGGKAMLFTSDRAGYRSHGSWGAEDDAYLMFFDLDAYEKFKMSKEEKELALAEAKDAKKDAKDSKDKKDSKKGSKKKPQASNLKPQNLNLDFENCQDRIVRLTASSSHMGDMALTQGGDTLYYMASFEGKPDLWMHDMREDKTELVMKGIGNGSMELSKDGKSIFICGNEGIKKFDVGKKDAKPIDFEARFNYKPYQERQYMFDHVWRQVKDKFYDPKLHGVDWEYYRTAYEKFLPYINNGYDFKDMLSEMLGELNASHTGSGFRPASAVDLQTAYLGAFFDESYTGDGLKIEEIIKRGPFDVKKSGVKKGDIIEAIDGDTVKAGMDYNYMLDGKAGKKVRLNIFSPKTNKHFNVVVKAISYNDQDEILYRRWVDRNRQLVDSLSGGKLAYVHVKAMDSESFRTVYRELLSDKNRNRQAVIVDERHNGGGWLHDDLCTLLSGKEYEQFVPHGQYIGRDPFNKWTKPSCVMICEDDYSNGHGFPKVYHDLGIGKLIGTPVAGTMTAVWWEYLIDGNTYFGIPQVGCRDMSGKFGENQQLNPDIEVYNTPDDMINGHDTQLEKAVEVMMRETSPTQGGEH